MVRKIQNMFENFKFWWNETIKYPFFDFVLNHLNWIPYDIKGQLFRIDDIDTNAVYIKWHGIYNKSFSTVTEKRLVRKFKDLPSGTVFVCRYIWGTNGRLKNVRDVYPMFYPDELKDMSERERILLKSNKPNEYDGYISDIETFEMCHSL